MSDLSRFVQNKVWRKLEPGLECEVTFLGISGNLIFTKMFNPSDDVPPVIRAMGDNLVKNYFIFNEMSI